MTQMVESCPVCWKPANNDYGLIAHLCEKHEEYRPLKSLASKIKFPFVCTECRVTIRSMLSYLTHILHCHPEGFEKIKLQLKIGGNTTEIPNSLEARRACEKRTLNIPYNQTITFFSGCTKDVMLLEASDLERLHNHCKDAKELFIKPILFFTLDHSEWKLVFLYLGHQNGITVLDFHGQEFMCFVCDLNEFFASHEVFLAATRAEKNALQKHEIDISKMTLLEDVSGVEESLLDYLEGALSGSARCLRDLMIDSNYTYEEAIIRPISLLLFFASIAHPLFIQTFIEAKSIWKTTTTTEKEIDISPPQYPGELSDHKAEIDQKEYYRRQEAVSKKRFAVLGKSINPGVIETERICPLCSCSCPTEEELYTHMYSEHKKLQGIMNTFRSPLSGHERKHICYKCQEWYSEWREFVWHVTMRHREHLLWKTRESASGKERLLAWVDRQLELEKELRDDDDIPTRESVNMSDTSEGSDGDLQEYRMMIELDTSDEYGF